MLLLGFEDESTCVKFNEKQANRKPAKAQQNRQTKRQMKGRSTGPTKITEEPRLLLGRDPLTETYSLVRNKSKCSSKSTKNAMSNRVKVSLSLSAMVSTAPPK
jgi:hypothetical protein